MDDIKESREWKEQMLKARINQAKTKINSIEAFTRQLYLGGESARIAAEEIRQRRQALKDIQAIAEQLAKDLGKTNFSWSKALKEEKGS